MSTKPKGDSSEVTEEVDNQTGDLMSFQFDDDSTKFFGIEVGGEEESQTTKTIKEVKKVGSGESTELDKVKPAKAGKQDQIDDEDDLDENEPEVTFFEEKPKKTPPKKATKKEEDDQVDENEVDETEEKDEEDEVVSRKGTKKRKEGEEGDQPGEDDKDEDEEEKTDDEFYTTLAQEMIEDGIFTNVKLEKDEKVTLERFKELQDEEVDARADEVIEALIENLDEDGKNFLRFKKNGGNTMQFLATVANRFDVKEFDETNPEHIQKVAHHYITTVEKLSGEELADRLEYLKDSGKDKTSAKKWFDTLKANQKKEEEALLQAAEDNRKKKEEDAKKFSTELKEVFESTKAVGKFKITKSDKDLVDYINKPTEKVGKNKFTPKMLVDLTTILRGGTPEDKKKLLLLGKLLKSEFDISDVETEVQTTVTRKAQSKLREAKQNPRLSTSGKYGGKKTLADLFPD